MNLEITTKTLYENTTDEKWIVEVTIKLLGANPRIVRAYVDDSDIIIEPSGTAKRCEFGWNDWIFENIGGNIHSGAAMAALAVVMDDLLSPKPGTATLTCYMCACEMPQSEAIEKGWLPEVYSFGADARVGPICPKHHIGVRQGSSGEMEMD